MDALREIGVEAERVMMAATGGVNTHRGAIFGRDLYVRPPAPLGPGLGAPGFSGAPTC